MEKIKTKEMRNVNTLGVFDATKGLGLIFIIMGHTLGLFSEYLSESSNALVYPFSLGPSFIAAFFIISGYGFRKISIGKSIKQQFKMYFKPYIFTMISTVLLHSIVHSVLFFRDNFPSLIVEHKRVLRGFLFGLPHAGDFLGRLMYSCGPIWFLLALAVSWIILDILCNILPEKYVKYGVLLTMIIGWVLCAYANLPYCISQGLVATFFLYIGKEAHRSQLFKDNSKIKIAIICLICSALIMLAGVYIGQSLDDITLGHWNLGPIGIIVNGVFGLAIVYLSLFWDKKAAKLFNATSFIGRNSLDVFCIHTIEMQALPWNRVAPYFKNNPTLGIIVIFALRVATILLMFCILKTIKKIQSKNKYGG